MTHQSIKEALEWRYAVKQFDKTKKITDQDWQSLTESLKLAPSSYGLQPWKFLVIENTEVREKLRAVSWNQSQVTDSSRYVVFTYKEKLDVDFVDNYLKRISQVRNVPVESLTGFRDMMIENLIKGPRSQTIDAWAQRQSYIAMGFLMETAALLKIDACPMEGLDTNAYDEILGLKGTGWKTGATVALGYRHPEDKYQLNKKVRFEDEALFEYIK
ncbi:NAD(P)H-dependent oxidoreductase [Bdellovibrio sp. HCB2-146]|uniref:NAD(P)H-dependent oxidoreductase n=1 Tax=Bdellovibrio sp. HCB2-146 TaxID=3394362 RepID=UPI0039BCE189